jgi:hypothetical protein
MNYSPFEWRLMYRSLTQVDLEYIPAPSMTEVWRELPKGLLYESKWHRLYLSKCQGNEDSFTEYSYEDQAICGSVHRNTNPTDALIDLLIWVRKASQNCGTCLKYNTYDGTCVEVPGNYGHSTEIPDNFCCDNYLRKEK